MSSNFASLPTEAQPATWTPGQTPLPLALFFYIHLLIWRTCVQWAVSYWTNHTRPVWPPETLLVHDLIKRSYVRRQTGTAVVPCPRHEYRLLEDGRTLLGPAETRWKVCNYRYTSQWKMSLKTKYQHIKLLHIYHMDLQKPIQAEPQLNLSLLGVAADIIWSFGIWTLSNMRSNHPTEGGSCAAALFQTCSLMWHHAERQRVSCLILPP